MKIDFAHFEIDALLQRRGYTGVCEIQLLTSCPVNFITGALRFDVRLAFCNEIRSEKMSGRVRWHAEVRSGV